MHTNEPPPALQTQKLYRSIRERLMGVLCQDHRIRRDQIEAFDDFLPEILSTVKTQLSFQYIDYENKCMHHISVKRCFFSRPLLDKLDTIDLALLHGKYLAHVCGDIKHDIRIPNPDPQSEANLSKKRHIFNQYSIIQSTSITYNVRLLEIPALIGSELCNTTHEETFLSTEDRPYIQSGNFCISGHFKEFPFDETTRRNTVLNFKPDQCQIRSSFVNFRKKYRTNTTLKVFIHQKKLRNVNGWINQLRIMVTLPHESPPKSVPISLIVLALGQNIDTFVALVKSMLFRSFPSNIHSSLSKHIMYFLEVLRSDTLGCNTSDEAILKLDTFISKGEFHVNNSDVSSYVRFVLFNEILPHLNRQITSNFCIHKQNIQAFQSAYLLARVCTTIIRTSSHFKMRLDPIYSHKLTKQSSWVNQRVLDIGICMVTLIRRIIKRWTKTLVLKLKFQIRKKVDIKALFSNCNDRLTKAIRSGNWDIKYNQSATSRVHKTHKMTTGYVSDGYCSTHIVNAACSKSISAKAFLPDPTSYGRVDLSLTPESERCGTVKYKAIGGITSRYVNLIAITQQLIESLLVIKDKSIFQPCHNIDSIRQLDLIIDHTCLPSDVIAPDGTLIGFTSQPSKLCEYFRQIRSKDHVPRRLDVALYNDNIEFNIDQGRLLRPLIVARNLKQCISYMQMNPYWKDNLTILEYMGFIEFLSAAEEYHSDIIVSFDWHSNDSKITHFEIHGLTAYSVISANNFCSFDMGPRRVYAANMRKRTISMKSYIDQGSIMSHTLWYGQIPIMSNIVDKLLRLRKNEPNGVNINVAIMCVSQNQEDAWVMKKECIDRGVGICIEMYSVCVTKHESGTFMKPSLDCIGLSSSFKYDGIGMDGFPIPGRVIPGGYAVVGQVYSNSKNQKYNQQCISTFLSEDHMYIVDKVVKYPTEKDPSVVKVFLKRNHNPEVGDKFCLGHGQKGTLGKIVPSIDLPFYVDDGTTPDLLLNVTALLRATIGLMLEMLFGTAKCISPSMICEYETVFLPESKMKDKIEIVEQILKRRGLTSDGKRSMCSGITGKIMPCRTFNGFGYLNTLNHFSCKKLRARERGPVNEMTRQPTAGKQHHGGQKIGEMMNWNLTSYGMSETMRTLNYDCSDKFEQLWCEQCAWYTYIPIGSDDLCCVHCNNEHNQNENFKRTFKKLKL